jgi:hypothetical protein
VCKIGTLRPGGLTHEFSPFGGAVAGSWHSMMRKLFQPRAVEARVIA